MLVGESTRELWDSGLLPFVISGFDLLHIPMNELYQYSVQFSAPTELARQ
jgi:hypothetical protein